MFHANVYINGKMARRAYAIQRAFKRVIVPVRNRKNRYFRFYQNYLCIQFTVFYMNELQRNENKKRVLDLVYNFFVESHDFNGIPLRTIGEELKIEYKASIDLIIELVMEERVSIQSSTNPHIIGLAHHKPEDQNHILEEAKHITFTAEKFGELTFVRENTEFPICVYPSPNYLQQHRDLTIFGNAVYSKQLALGNPQLQLVYFDIEVLDLYAGDPRYAFRFNDYSGDIYCNYDENEQPLVRDEDEIFLKSFGLGYDESGNRLAVVPLTYLKQGMRLSIFVM